MLAFRSRGVRNRVGPVALLALCLLLFSAALLPATPADPSDEGTGISNPASQDAPASTRASRTEDPNGTGDEEGAPPDLEEGTENAPNQAEDAGGLLDFPAEDPVLDEPPLEFLLFEEEDLVEAASRKTSRLSEAPGTITLLDREEIDRLGVLTLGDLLRTVNSSALVPGTVDTALEFRGVQQPFNNKILLLQDGRILNNTYRGDFSLDLSQLLDDVQRVEVVQGPGSALYGANAFAGFINLVTRKGADVDGVETRTAFGGDALWYQNVLTGGETGGVDWLVRGRVAGVEAPDLVNPLRENNDQQDVHLRGRMSGETWFVDIGAFDVRAGSPGTFRFPTSQDRAELRQVSIDGRKVWELGEKTKIAVRSFYTDADNTYRFVSLDLPDCQDGSPFCDVAGSDFWSQTLDVVTPDGTPVPTSVRRAEGILLGSTSPLRKKGESGDPDVYIDRDTYDAWRAGELGDRVEVQESRERRAFTEVQFDYAISKSNYLLLGGGMQADILRNSSVGDHTFRDLFAFIEDEQRFLDDQLILLGSVRLDDHSYFGNTASPRLSLIYVPKMGDGAARLVQRQRTPLWIKAGYGKAFRSPNFVELFGSTRVGPEGNLFGLDRPGVAILSGNEDLEQESIETYELQIHVEPSATFETTLTFFDYSIENEVILNIDRDIVFGYQETTRIPRPDTFELVFDEDLTEVPTGAQFLNVADGTEGHGVELGISWSPRRRARGLTLWGNYSRVHLDRPVERELVFDINSESGAVLGEGRFRIRREGGLQDGLNLGLLYQGREDRWFAHYRARVTGELGDSIFSRGARVAHDVSLGLNLGRLRLRGTVFNLTGEDMLRDPTDGTWPDMEARWHLLMGYRWEF